MVNERYQIYNTGHTKGELEPMILLNTETGTSYALRIINYDKNNDGNVENLKWGWVELNVIPLKELK